MPLAVGKHSNKRNWIIIIIIIIIIIVVIRLRSPVRQNHYWSLQAQDGTAGTSKVAPENDHFLGAAAAAVLTLDLLVDRISHTCVINYGPLR
jgi:hypothetical protein